MASSAREQLLALLCAVVAERPVPPLDPQTGGEEHEALECIRLLSCLWSKQRIPTISSDPVCFGSAFIWLKPESFRYAFLRLLVAGVGDRDSEGADLIALELAAEPVPRDSVSPPDRFQAFSPSELHLVSEVIDELVESLPGELPETKRRIVRRAQCNWRRFAGRK